MDESMNQTKQLNNEFTNTNVRLYLINLLNLLVSIRNVSEGHRNRCGMERQLNH